MYRYTSIFYQNFWPADVNIFFSMRLTTRTKIVDLIINIKLFCNLYNIMTMYLFIHIFSIMNKGKSRVLREKYQWVFSFVRAWPRKCHFPYSFAKNYNEKKIRSWMNPQCSSRNVRVVSEVLHLRDMMKICHTNFETRARRDLHGTTYLYFLDPGTTLNGQDYGKLLQEKKQMFVFTYMMKYLSARCHFMPQIDIGMGWH